MRMHMQTPITARAGMVWARRAALHLALLAGVVSLLGAGAGVIRAGEPEAIGAVPSAVRKQFKLAPFYQKYLDVGTLPVVGSTNVSDDAMREAAWIVRQMLTNRADILRAMSRNGVRLAVMAYTEFTTDIPEHSRLKPKVFWDRRAR